MDNIYKQKGAEAKRACIGKKGENERGGDGIGRLIPSHVHNGISREKKDACGSCSIVISAVLPALALPEAATLVQLQRLLGSAVPR
jgi:hypothetical protein